jgi:hypothetical protein
MSSEHTGQGWHIGFAAQYAAQTLQATGFAVREGAPVAGQWSVQAQRGAGPTLVVSGGRKLGVEHHRVEARLGPVAVELQVRPELVGEWMDKALGITVDTEVGDAAFDHRFVVCCAPSGAAPQVLPPRVRAALRAMAARVEAPTLSVGRDGALSLAWHGPCDAALLQCAVEATQEVAAAVAGLFEGVADDGVAGPFRAASVGGRAVDPGARERDRRRFAAGTRRFVTLVTSAAMLGAGVVAGVLSGAL